MTTVFAEQPLAWPGSANYLKWQGKGQWFNEMLLLHHQRNKKYTFRTRKQRNLRTASHSSIKYEQLNIQTVLRRSSKNFMLNFETFHDKVIFFHQYLLFLYLDCPSHQLTYIGIELSFSDKYFCLGLVSISFGVIQAFSLLILTVFLCISHLIYF